MLFPQQVKTEKYGLTLPFWQTVSRRPNGNPVTISNALALPWSLSMPDAKSKVN
jgi:hypothetical protein